MPCRVFRLVLPLRAYDVYGLYTVLSQLPRYSSNQRRLQKAIKTKEKELKFAIGDLIDFIVVK